MVHQLQQAYAGKVAFKVFTVDRLAANERDEMSRYAELADFHVTPTVLVIDRTGRVVSRYEGVTSYWTLKRDLDRVAAD